MDIVIVEDSELIRNQLLRLVSLHSQVNVVGTAGEETAAVDLILACNPAAVLLDLALAPGSGMRVLEKIREAGSGARVLILTNNADEALRSACEAFGISGFYDKSRDVLSCMEKLFSWLPPVPANEIERLRALQLVGLLDSPEQEIFDGITRMATVVADTPIALISLVDKDRQWFLSHTGLAQKQTSRSVAFCAHAIINNDLMEVPDALADPRFCDNPLVVGEPKIRFYAGVPLTLTSGESLGTLCVIDTRPRELTIAQRGALKTLARSALAEIELRRRVIGLEKEVERRTAAEAHIYHLSTRDALTALPNRVNFRERLVQGLRFANRAKSGLAVLFIDLDRFKLINDTLGHEAGDTALIAAADRMAKALRDSDTVARLGGDEFAVLLCNLENPEESKYIADKLIKELQQPFVFKGHRLQIGASIGIALYPRDGATAEDLLRRADLAMYQAKHQGGTRSVLFDSQMDERAEAALALENDLRDAIDNNEIQVFYQPQVALNNGKVSGMEALVRWNHPHLGLLSPDTFIHLAEERGLIKLIDEKVMDIALGQLVAWDADGWVIPRMAINVSAAELRAGYAETVSAMLLKHEVPADRLEIEITESAMTSDGVEFMRVLRELRSRGMRIAVDDFGVGYSSLGQLRRLPIDALKIDKSFIDEVDINPQDVAIVKAVVTMADALGLRTIAEGIESESQLQKIEQLGCQCVQGYLLSKPMPAREAAVWLTDYANAQCGDSGFA